MMISKIFVVALGVAACSKQGPAQDPFAPQLGESTKSPGANASKPAPLTPDDPRVMNVSATITPQQLQQAQRAPQQPQATPSRDQATSSTPVQQPTPITPPSTNPEPERPGVFSPPPPPPQ